LLDFLSISLVQSNGCAVCTVQHVHIDTTGLLKYVVREWSRIQLSEK
jgi:hypothetical protein